MKRFLSILVPAALAVSPVFAQDQARDQTQLQEQMPSMTAVSEGQVVSLIGKNEQELGTVRIEDAPHGVVLTVEVNGLSEGWHGFHIHEFGDCSDREGFQSAGGHLSAEGQSHGYRNEASHHTGDLPNIWVNPTGAGKAQFFVNSDIRRLMHDENGSAFVVHEGADDYRTDPAGDSGGRVACGVIAPVAR